MLHHYKPPVDGYTGAWVGRAWQPGPDGEPCVAAVRPDGVFDITRRVATIGALLDAADPAGLVRWMPGERIGDVEALLANSDARVQDASRPWLLAPVDLQAIKACGVTFAASMLQRPAAVQGQAQQRLDHPRPVPAAVRRQPLARRRAARRGGVAYRG